MTPIVILMHSAISPIGNLSLQESSSNHVRLAAPGAMLDVSYLRPDLLRLRATSGGAFASNASWAVHGESWPGIPMEIENYPGRMVLSSTRARLEINLVEGSWSLTNDQGVELFAIEPGGMQIGRAGAGVTLRLAEREAVFGLGETTGTFNKRGLVREFWNIDVRGHTPVMHAGLRKMYLSIPFALSLRCGLAAGLFWDDPGYQRWDIGQGRVDQWEMTASKGEIDLYIFVGPSCAAVLERFAELTGRMPMPPLWGLGYQQCRYSYETRAKVEEIAREFRRRRIPCDVIYLDIHHMDEYRVFTFGPSFPRPAKLAAELAAQGFKLVTIVDPGVKDEPGFDVLRRGRKLGAFIKDAGGKADYIGEVWPGAVRFPDFLNPVTRRWWGAEQGRLQSLGIAGFWNDMNEPADFSRKNKEIPGRCRHSTKFGEVRHADVHNVYGMEMARASYEGALAHRPGQRPFIITRAGYAGVQRYAIVWTGDNHSSWEHMADSVQMLLNLSLSGVPFCGADAGGFMDNATGELLARWTQLAAFTPFFRNHSNIGTIDQEPWAFGPEIEAICRRHIELRYELLPYLYGLFIEAHRCGTPIMRPLLWHYQDDPLAVAAGDQFMLGRDLLIAPILSQGARARSVYLPSGTWFDFWNGQKKRGGRHLLAEGEIDKLPIFVRAGAIVPRVPVQQFLGEHKIDTVSLHVWPGSGTELNWYEDDGQTLEYLRGVRTERRISLRTAGRESRLRFGAQIGGFSSGVKRWRVVLWCAKRTARASVKGREVASQYDRSRGVCTFEFDNEDGAFDVTWR
jgi:alpha-glucosidase